MPIHSTPYDLIIVGGGTAGLAAAIPAASRGLRVAIVESMPQLGGTLHWAAGLMSAAGTRLQQRRGIVDTPDAHFADVMEISRGTADPEFVRKAVGLAADTIDWLMEAGFDVDPACPGNVTNHAFYRTERTYWGRDKARSILAVLLRELQALGPAAPETLLKTRVTGLLRDGDGSVQGVQVRNARGEQYDLPGRRVLMTSGGFAGNPEMFERMTGRRLYGPMPDGSDGSGMELLARAGADWRLSPYLMSSVGGVESAPGSRKVSFYERPQLIPQHRQPWEIYVDSAGRRFMREDEPDINAREHALAGLPDTTFWIVFDQQVLTRAPALFPMWTRPEFERFLQTHHAVSRADSIAALAGQAGLDAQGLADSVASYNAAATRQTQDALGRTHLPCALACAPYYAIRNHAVIIKTPHGIRVDTDLRVLEPEGRPIKNLYACGEVLGGSLLSGNSYVTGMSITPALSFGHWLGQTLQ